jgi:hypothetical protein
LTMFQFAKFHLILEQLQSLIRLPASKSMCYFIIINISKAFYLRPEVSWFLPAIHVNLALLSDLQLPSITGWNCRF